MPKKDIDGTDSSFLPQAVDVLSESSQRRRQEKFSRLEHNIPVKASEFHVC